MHRINSMRGILYHKTLENVTVNWDVSYIVGRDIHIIQYNISGPTGRESQRELVDIPTLMSLDPETYVRNTVNKWAKRNGYTAVKPEHPLEVRWHVKEHLGNQVVVMYEINDTELKATITIPGADDKITEEMVCSAIENEVRAAARRRRFTGLTGVVKLPRKGVDTDDNDAENTAKR